jgi:hypothetical protein
MNWAKAVVYLMSAECALASVLYLLQGNLKQAAYFSLAALINLVVTL